MSRRSGPAKFLYPGLKLHEIEVQAMAKAWIRAEKLDQCVMSKVEEALTYGASINPDQCFRVIREICRKTKEKKLLQRVGVNLLEDLLANSAHKIKRKLTSELKHSQSLRQAMKSVWLLPSDRGFQVAAPLIARYKNA